ncbi:MAG: insulinase family protein, partial [Pseudomonadota bacterium]|nr:insulinase family protein [Pseudomonadota bacterium]
MLHQSLGFRRKLALGVASGVLAAALAIPAAVLAQPATAQRAATSPWGVPLTDVTVDPAVKYGRLANGMRYAIVRNATPKGAAAVRMQFEFGSIGESDEERGLAHFIEHMAFNGSTNVPEGDMVKILERQGLKFGPDTNASTGFDETIYMLDLPKADDEHVDTALMLMREIAGELKFDPAAVDRERGVILGERRVRDTFQLHQITDIIGFQVPNTPYPNRLPIGTEEVLKTASAATMRALYHRFYRPENATFVFVGDADPTLIEAKIKAKFADWKGVGPAAAPLPRGTVDFKRTADFDTFVDPAVATTVSLATYRPWQNPADTLANRRIDTARALALAMFNRRFQRLVNAPGSVLLGGGMGEDKNKDASLGAAFTVAAKDGAWKEALTVTEQELRRALSHGFSASELDLQRADTLGKLTAAAGQADARPHSALAGAILATVGEPDFVTTPEFRRAYFAQVAPTLTVAEINAQFREMWNGSAPLVHVSAKQAIDEAALAAAFAGSTKVAVAAPAEEAAVAFAYDRFGTPGKIVEDRRIADLGIRTVRFANNVRLNIKQTDFEKGKVNFAVRLAGGGLALPTDKPGLATMVSALSALSATGKHSLEDIKTVTAGRLVTPGVVVG